MTYLQGECSHRGAYSVPRFNVSRVLVLSGPPVRLSSALGEVAGSSMAAVTDFDDNGPSLSEIVTTVPFTVHSAIAKSLLDNAGAVDYAVGSGKKCSKHHHGWNS